MDPHRICWNICLKAPPKIVLIGTAVHGERRLTEQYHSNVWVLLLIHYFGEIVADGVVFPVKPGFAALFPPETTLTIRYRGRSMHRYAHLGLRGGRGDEVPIAAITDLRDDFAALDLAYQEAIQVHPRTPERSSMLLWELLWKLAARTGRPPASQQHHPAVARALGMIESRLGEPLRVSQIVQSTSLSHRQLSELFRRELNTTIVGYIRKRRVERAQYLLTQTQQPIKTIAADVGIPDLQQFNKTLRHLTGRSPRHLRDGE